MDIVLSEGLKMVDEVVPELYWDISWRNGDDDFKRIKVCRIEGSIYMFLWMRGVMLQTGIGICELTKRAEVARRRVQWIRR